MGEDHAQELEECKLKIAEGEEFINTCQQEIISMLKKIEANFHDDKKLPTFEQRKTDVKEKPQQIRAFLDYFTTQYKTKFLTIPSCQEIFGSIAQNLKDVLDHADKNLNQYECQRKSSRYIHYATQTISRNENKTVLSKR